MSSKITTLLAKVKMTTNAKIDKLPLIAYNAYIQKKNYKKELLLWQKNIL